MQLYDCAIVLVQRCDGPDLYQFMPSRRSISEWKSGNGLNSDPAGQAVSHRSVKNGRQRTGEDILPAQLAVPPGQDVRVDGHRAAQRGGPPLGVDDDAHLVLAPRGLRHADGAAQQRVAQRRARRLPAAQPRLERVGRDWRERRGRAAVVVPGGEGRE